MGTGIGLQGRQNVGYGRPWIAVWDLSPEVTRHIYPLNHNEGSRPKMKLFGGMKDYMSCGANRFSCKEKLPELDFLLALQIDYRRRLHVLSSMENSNCRHQAL